MVFSVNSEHDMRSPMHSSYLHEDISEISISVCIARRQKKNSEDARGMDGRKRKNINFIAEIISNFTIVEIE